jgi:hypothetical protein
MSEQEFDKIKGDEPEDTEGHGFRGGEPEGEKRESDEGDDVEGHAFKPGFTP